MPKPNAVVLFTALTALSGALVTAPVVAQTQGGSAPGARARPAPRRPPPPPPPVAPAPTDDIAAEPDPTEQARARFKRGVEFYGAGDYAAAMVEFQRAYDIAPNYRLLYNLGQTSFELRDYPAALRAFERYLAEGGDEIGAERRTEVEGEISKLRNYVARITLTVDAGAEVVVDGQLVGVSPLPEAILVSAGRREISVTKAGYAPLQRFIDVAGGESTELELTLSPLQVVPAPRPAPLPAPAPAPKPPPPVASGGIGAGVWVGLGATVALGAAAGIVGGLALGAKSDYDAQLNTFPTTQVDIDDAGSKVRTLAGATDGLIAATGVAAVITIAVLAVDLSNSDDGAEVAAAPKLQLRAGPTSLGLWGTF